ncbi:GntR family transcriptional regulator [Streptomyces sp. HUAS 31]|uniref:GntR family transcriptional regulator n=1 Tax=Streptomyces TaxID=1883 RepID=UPI00230593BD|nr:GntR family transcriptional regulator [Streptomyces sp. HUAS 31]WCE00377.1 GntR family transcriptional regulator [Streptomyces sp. HUAS 31]
MKQGAQGSAVTGNPDGSGGLDGAEGVGGVGVGGPEVRADVPRVPVQGRGVEEERGGRVDRAERVERADRVERAERGVDGGPGRGGAGAVARGEHTHSETPIPRPRALVQRASVRGQILDALRTALVTGELTPGAVYSAPALGERFGVSATPVREAMQQLALEGAVEVVPNRGFRVVERGARELAELAEVRALIEVPVMLRLARTVSVERWAELRPLAEATVRAASSGCRATYAESDRSFHRAVLAFCGNEQLVQLADDLHRRAQWPLVGPVRVSGRGHADLLADAAEHMALLDALIARDLDVVRSLVGEHFAGAR